MLTGNRSKGKLALIWISGGATKESDVNRNKAIDDINENYNLNTAAAVVRDENITVEKTIDAATKAYNIESHVTSFLQKMIKNRLKHKHILFPHSHNELEPQRGFELVEDKCNDKHHIDENTDVISIADSLSEESKYDSIDSGTDDDTYTENNEQNKQCSNNMNFTGNKRDDERTKKDREEEKNEDSDDFSVSTLDTEGEFDLHDVYINNDVDTVPDKKTGDMNKNENKNDTTALDLNVMLNFNDLVTFISNNFKCAVCGNKPSTSHFQHTSCGISSSMIFRCHHCRRRHCITSEKRKTEQDNDESTNKGKKHGDYHHML